MSGTPATHTRARLPYCAVPVAIARRSSSRPSTARIAVLRPAAMITYSVLSSRSCELFSREVSSSRPVDTFTPTLPFRSRSVTCCQDDHPSGSAVGTAVSLTRRAALSHLTLATVGAVAALDVWRPERSEAVQQNQLAGRIPGLSEEDENGLRTYRRPDGKSGGHGVGWSPIIPYTFRVTKGWDEIPVSIADLGGTEIDLRFQNPSEGNLSVVVAPVLRFSDGLGNNVKIEDIGNPDKVIEAFGPELTGQNVEGKVKDMEVRKYDGRTYYQYELDVPHMLVCATAAGNRLYLLSLTANGRQWKKYASSLRQIQDSFRVESA